MSIGDVHVERHGPAALVTLNRPEKRNALSIEMRSDLAAAIESLADDQHVAAIGLTGAGSAFCAGMDVTQFGGDESHRHQLVESSVRAFDTLAWCAKPTIALVNGPAFGGGFALALLCDVRVASPSARFAFSELRRGIPPSHAAAAAVLPQSVACDLCLTGREIDASEALQLGVVSRISDGAAALREVASAPRAATDSVKRRILMHRAGANTAELLAGELRDLRTAVLGRD